MKYSRWKDASHEFEICIKCRPNVAIYHYKLSQVLWNMGDEKGSKIQMAKVLEIDPYHPKARFDDKSNKDATFKMMNSKVNK